MTGVVQRTRCPPASATLYLGEFDLPDPSALASRPLSPASCFGNSHPSGHFSRDNPKLHLITRKLRARKSTSGRRGSSASTDAGLDRDYEAEDQDQEEEEGAINVQDEPNVVAPEEHRHYAPAFHDHHPLHSASPFSLYPLPARSPHDQWQSPYPSPLHAPFHSPTNGILGLPHPSMLTGLHHSGSYFSPPLASYSPTMMETSRFDGAHGSGMPSSSHCASGMVAPLGIGIGGAPPSPANSTSSSSEVEAQPQPHNPHDMGFASPPHPRAPLLHHELCLTSASEHSSIATSSPDFKPSSANATTDFYSHPSQSFGLLYTTSEAHHA